MGQILGTKTYTENGQTYRLIVEGGLNYIKGNRKPYFSITATRYIKKGNNRFYEDACGCLHDDISKVFNGRFDDLIAMHLADMDGQPMHAYENGAYWLGFSDYQAFDPKIASKHFGLSEEEMRAYWMQIIKKDDVKQLCDKLAPTWQKRANDCIKKYSLQICGDKYQAY